MDLSKASTGFLFSDPEFRPTDPEFCTVDIKSKKADLDHQEDRLHRLGFPVQRHATLERVVEMGALPAPGEQLRIITFKNFTALEFLDYILEQGPITSLALVIFSLSQVNAYRLKTWLLEGKIHRREILLSNLRNTAAAEKEASARDHLAQLPNVEIFFAGSHAKIMTMETAAGEFYTLEGSGNLASNSRIEQYVLDNSEPL